MLHLFASVTIYVSKDDTIILYCFISHWQCYSTHKR